MIMTMRSNTYELPDTTWRHMSFHDWVRDRLVKVLALPTSGKSHLQELARKKLTNVTVWDTDLVWLDYYPSIEEAFKPAEELSRVGQLVKVGAFFTNLEEMYSAYLANETDGHWILVTNLWYWEITSVLIALDARFDFSFLPKSGDIILERVVRRGTELEGQNVNTYDKWVRDARDVFPSITKSEDRVIELNRDQYVSDFMLSLIK